MNNSFPRMLTLLRKERGLSQKAAAQELGVSQALLSHYEKGIRECGLAFIVRAADFYEVSCDYLLGRTPHRTGATIKAEDLPEPPSATADVQDAPSSPESALHKKLITNSLHVLFGLLDSCGSEPLTEEASALLETTVYKLFRMLYMANPKNPKGLFAFPALALEGYASAAMAVAEANVRSLLMGEGFSDKKALGKGAVPALSPEILSSQYPLFSEALFRLIREAETRMALFQAGQ